MPVSISKNQMKPSILCFKKIQVCSMRLPNCAGRGERFTADFTYGSKNALGWSLNFNKPLLGDPNLL